MKKRVYLIFDFINLPGSSNSNDSECLKSYISIASKNKPSELPFLDVEAIAAEIVSMAVLIQVSSKFSKLSASFRVSLTLLLI